ncbi:hypothetical protein CSUI_008151, partial [Cystoisospora suis]
MPRRECPPFVPSGFFKSCQQQ